MNLRQPLYTFTGATGTQTGLSSWTFCIHPTHNVACKSFKEANRTDVFCFKLSTNSNTRLENNVYIVFLEGATRGVGILVAEK